MDEPEDDLRVATPRCTFQSTGTGTECDEDQFSIPEVASDGTVYVHFLNFQNEDEWEMEEEFDIHHHGRRSPTDGGDTWSGPGAGGRSSRTALSDMPWTVIGSAVRRGVTRSAGHASGNI